MRRGLEEIGKKNNEQDQKKKAKKLLVKIRRKMT